MSNKKSKRGSTQAFTEIKDIIENVVLLSSGNACLVIEIQASNFSLLSKQEQDAHIVAYAQLLNSLSFPIQIVIRNKKIDLSSYIKLLAKQEQTQPQSANYLREYRVFVESLITANTVLEKRFFITIPYSFLEKGTDIDAVRVALHTKAATILSQLARLGVRARTLGKEELVRLFFDIYNEAHGVSEQFAVDHAPVVQGRGGEKEQP